MLTASVRNWVPVVLRYVARVATLTWSKEIAAPPGVNARIPMAGNPLLTRARKVIAGGAPGNVNRVVPPDLGVTLLLLGSSVGSYVDDANHCTGLPENTIPSLANSFVTTQFSQGDPPFGSAWKSIRPANEGVPTVMDVSRT